jgi:hypothetical protein
VVHAVGSVVVVVDEGAVVDVVVPVAAHAD